jgi:amino acid transporter
MLSLLPPHFVPQEVSENDLAVASIAWGFFMGFGWLTMWTAVKQTRHIYKRHGSATWRNSYVWMIWLEIFVCVLFSVICWLHLKGTLPPRFVVAGLSVVQMEGKTC